MAQSIPTWQQQKAAAAVLAVGIECDYTTPQGVLKRVKIIKIHFDDPPEPYYTIQLDDAERQTVRKKLQPVNDDWENESVDLAAVEVVDLSSEDEEITDPNTKYVIHDLCSSSDNESEQ